MSTSRHRLRGSPSNRIPVPARSGTVSSLTGRRDREVMPTASIPPSGLNSMAAGRGPPWRRPPGPGPVPVTGSCVEELHPMVGVDRRDDRVIGAEVERHVVLTGDHRRRDEGGLRESALPRAAADCGELSSHVAAAASSRRQVDVVRGLGAQRGLPHQGRERATLRSLPRRLRAGRAVPGALRLRRPPPRRRPAPARAGRRRPPARRRSRRIIRACTRARSSALRSSCSACSCDAARNACSVSVRVVVEPARQSRMRASRTPR